MDIIKETIEELFNRKLNVLDKTYIEATIKQAIAKAINEIVRGEKTSIDALRREIKQRLGLDN